LLADLLNYHRREARPEWWAYFERQKKSLDDLVEDTEAIAWLREAPDEQPTTQDRSIVFPLDFPDQEYKLAPHPRNQLEDPFSGQSAGIMIRLDGQRSRLYLKRGKARSGQALPAAIAKGTPLDDRAQREALGRLADELVAGGPRYRAVRALLARELPRIGGRQPGLPVQTIDLAGEPRGTG
jgi:uncharacterized protein